MAPTMRPEALRVVSLSPAASRFIVGLGAASALVGVDVDSRSALPELAAVPTLELEGVSRLAPDLVIVPPGLEPRAAELASAAGFEAVVFDVHDLEDVFFQSQTLGVRLVGPARAALFERRIARPLAMIAGGAPALEGADVVAVVSVDPPQLAGGHSFATDLIQIAGGRSVTHGGDSTRLDADAATLAALAPDVVVVMRPVAVSPDELERLRHELSVQVPLFSFTVDFDRVLEGELEGRAEALRTELALHAGVDRAAAPRAGD